MSPSETLVESLKRRLRARGISYAVLATQIPCSVASVKRMFASRNFDLRRLDRILEILDEDLAEVARDSSGGRAELLSLTYDHEASIVADPVLFTVAVCALHQLEFQQIITIYRITPAAAVRALLQLDRMGFLSLHPNNLYTLRLSRTFRWLRDGPIVRHFRAHAGDFLDHTFDGPGECVGVINVRLSNERRLALMRRVEELAREYSEAHAADAPLPLVKRHPMSLLVAVRSWEPGFMRTLRRLDNPALAAWLRQQQSVGPDAKPHPTRAVRRRLGAALEALAPVRELARQTGVER
jgi:hypothetical protein